MIENTITLLDPTEFRVPMTMEEILAEPPTPVGYHAIAGYLECPERSRLKRLGFMKKARAQDVQAFDATRPMNALSFGSLVHALLAARVAKGMDVADSLLTTMPMYVEDQIKARSMLRMYDAEFPLDQEPWTYVGNEAVVVTNIALPGQKPVWRTVRYDKVVQQHDSVRGRVVLSLEHKTASRSGPMNAYSPQAFVQTALWNANPALVEKYGPMVGVVFDVLVKTQVPKVERANPKYVSTNEQRLALEYLRVAEEVKFPIAGDGSYPRFIHSCWGRFEPCEFISLCFDRAVGDYVMLERK